ncbi:MAG: hypothetical protein LC751_03655 [Actinobacteria bacterium]|nr:hypothetical protein [Actinomycetota bacterium]
MRRGYIRGGYQEELGLTEKASYSHTDRGHAVHCATLATAKRAIEGLERRAICK